MLTLALFHHGGSNIYWDFSTSSYGCCNSCFNGGWKTIFGNGTLPIEAPKEREFPRDSKLSLVKFPTLNDKICKRNTISDQNLIPTYKSPVLGGDGVFLNENACAGICKPLLELWALSTPIQEQLDLELANLERSYPARPLFGFHVRGGDKLVGEAKAYTLSLAVNNLKKMYEKRGERFLNGTCVIVGDDAQLERKLVPVLQNELGCYAIYSRLNSSSNSSAHDQGAFNAQSADALCYQTRRLLVDVEILARCDAAVGLMDSHVSRMAANLRRCRSNDSSSLANVLDWHGRDAYKYACNPYMPTR